ncbi:MAG TPA: ATP-binding protein [Polyangiaceae bacterium]
MNRIAHLVHGYLGAGKTTFAKELAARTGAIRYSPDELMVARHGHDPPERHFSEYLDAIFAEINAEWPRTLGGGCDVVLDFGFWTRAWRDMARARAASAGAETKLYFVRCSEAVARERCLRRNRELGGSLYISENTFDVLKARFEPLGPDEPFELVDTS